MRKRKGFTLIELVVVVMILGILAAVAAPKFFNMSDEARLNSARQSLAIVRDAIERHMAREGTFPANPSADLGDYLRGPFPVCPVGEKGGTAGVTVSSSPLNGAEGTPTNPWLYSSATGEFIINDAGYEMH
jgi:general secretion pathway protein G